MCNVSKRRPGIMRHWCPVCTPARPSFQVTMRSMTRRWHFERGQVPGWVRVARAVRFALVPGKMHECKARHEC